MCTKVKQVVQNLKQQRMDKEYTDILSTIPTVTFL